MSEWAAIIEAGAWPLLALFILLFLTFSSRLRSVVNRVSRKITKLKTAGVEIEFSSESARQLKDSFETAFEDFKSAAQREYKRLAKSGDIRERVATIVDVLKKVAAPHKGFDSKSRVTVYVPDVIFGDTLYQLINYWPKGKGAGRRFSQRSGALGLTWRQKENYVLADASMYGEDWLIEKWGMTFEEAQATTRLKGSYFCLCLREKTGVPVGVLYFDSGNPNVFGTNEKASGPGKNESEEIAAKLTESDEVKELVIALSEMLAKLREAETDIHVTDH